MPSQIIRKADPNDRSKEQGMQSKDKGNSYLAEARKALNRTTIFGFGRQQKYEDAADFFTKAGNAFKLASAFEEAGNAFLECANAYEQAGDNRNDVVNALVEAGNCFKKTSPVAAVTAFQRAIEIYNDSGRVGMSARYLKEIAEIFEADHNTAGAMDAYEQAAKMFELDKKQSNSNTCMLKVAQFASESGDLRKAAGIFESIAKESMTSKLGQYSAKGYLLQALLCFLATGDAVQLNNKINEYKNIDFSFAASRECDFIQKLTKAFEEYNGDDFAQACADFDRITPLDPWKTSMLLKSKSFISEAAGSDEPDLS